MRRYRNASAELLDLKHKLDGPYSQILLLRQVQLGVADDNLFLNELEAQYLKQFLQDTILLFSEIRDLYEQQSTRPGKVARVKWALHDASKVKKWEAVLRRQSSALANIMLLLNV